AVDTKSELPLALDVTPAHVNDGDRAQSLMEQAASRAAPRFFMLDAGYDQLKVYEAAQIVKAQAIIPLNLRREKEPPAGITANGTPCCSNGLCHDVLGSGRRHPEVSLSARNRQSRLSTRHGRLLVLKLWYGRQSGREGRP
ncbi:transposase, partial [Ruminiclostridium papyrosolvens]|uniref:transposase n=1 Tax=Ruminiclostridium papyrosolvens TaxID=29362 RepID=UPI001FA79E93